MSQMSESFFEGGALANSKQLIDVMVELERLVFIVAPRLESDYVLRVGGLEHKLKGIELKAKKENRLIEIKCENQSISFDDAVSKVKKEFEKEDKAYVLEGNKVIKAMARLEKVTLNKTQTAQLLELYANLLRKLSKLFAKQTQKKEDLVFKRAQKAFREQNLKELVLLDMLTEEPTPVYLQNSKKYMDLYGKLIFLYAKRVDFVLHSYPFTKADTITNQEKLFKTQEELNLKIKEKNNLYKNLKKTSQSLFK